MIEEKKVRVQDDLYMYVNGKTLDELVIPDDKPATGGFNTLNTNVEKNLIEDFNAMVVATEGVDDPNLAKAVKLYAKVKDVKKRNKDGIKPILKYLKKIDSLKDVKALNRNLKDFILVGYPLPFDIGVDADFKDTTKHCVMIGGPSIILPDTTYYKEGMEQTKDALLGVWSGMVSKLLTYTKLSAEDQAKYLKDALTFDAIIATLVKSQEEWSEYTKMYNPTKTSKVVKLLKPIKFKKLLEDLFGTIPEQIIVTDPRFLKGFSTLFNEENFELYKHWAYIKTIVSASPLLSEELRQIGATYSNALMGLAAVSSIEKQAYQLAGGVFSEPVGLYYGKKYFGEEAKKDVIDIVKDIIETYKKRVSENDFLEQSTKDKAILKLSKIEVKMGYPDKCDELYDKFEVLDEDSLFECVNKISSIRTADSLSKLNEPVDRTKWPMPGHMVNACYNPFTNDITFPAAILQAPFYSIKQTRSENLGGIGAVIGHEISHAFDNNGANCDENGNLNNWWTKNDLKNFKNKTKAMIKQFDGIELPQGKVNGAFVVSENIADNGGMVVTLEIMKSLPGANYEEYFLNWGRIWCAKQRPEYQKMLLSVDVHSPSVLRANMQPRNFEEWYTTFDVKKSDEMYLAPSKRVVIW